MCHLSRLEHIAHHKAKNRKHSQNKLAQAHVCTHTHGQKDSLKRQDFIDDLKDVSLLDDLTLQG